MLQWGHDLSVVEIGLLRLVVRSSTTRLQWGHDLSVVEIRRCRRAVRCCPCASMGPRPFSRGNSHSRLATLRNIPASMGPRPFSRGNPDEYWPMNLAVEASMGPRPFSRGNLALFTACIARWYCFNGATTFQSWKFSVAFPWYFCHVWLQWGHDLSVVEISQGSATCGFPGFASMGPRPFSRGNSFRPEGGDATCLGFNGATTFQSWKLAPSCPSWRTRSCFNGATTFQSWKSLFAPKSARIVALLAAFWHPQGAERALRTSRLDPNGRKRRSGPQKPRELTHQRISTGPLAESPGCHDVTPLPDHASGTAWASPGW